MPSCPLDNVIKGDSLAVHLGGGGDLVGAVDRRSGGEVRPALPELPDCAVASALPIRDFKRMTSESRAVTSLCHAVQEQCF
jgi:hypothetical protein